MIEMKKKILIMGAGFTGCTFARLLHNRGHEILIKEKTNHIGGLSYTKKSPNGILYEPFGARTFHTVMEKVKNFVLLYSKFNSYIHRKGMIINNKLLHYPISIESIKKLKERKKIFEELKNRPNKLDKKNFETCMISMLGPTLYNLFIKNYTEKMWGIPADKLTADWGPSRLEIRNKNSELFKGQWQGLPVDGYTELFKNMIKGINITYNNDEIDEENYDLVIYSGRIDELIDFKFDELPYRSLKFSYREENNWRNYNYGTVNLPQHEQYIRRANFKILHQNKTKENWIQYQTPVNVSKSNFPMYPINTKSSNLLFNKYLKEVCMEKKKIIPAGRLGLFKYLDMDKSIALAMEMTSLIESWTNIPPEIKVEKINALIKKY